MVLTKPVAVCVVVSLLVAVCSAAFAAPQAELWERWQANDPSSEIRVDHGAWSLFLAEYVDTRHPSGINRVGYSQVEPGDRRRLDGYLEYLQGIAVSRLERNEQFVYWVNLYNAFTVKLILDNYPVSSILKISTGLVDTGPWDMKLLKIEEQEVSLNDIEHRILRPIWKDNRMHYAVNCASEGCPNLQAVAFTAENVDSLPAKAARDYINHARGVDFRDGRVHASSIYKWYRSDFGSSDAALIEHWREHAGADLARKLSNYRRPIRYDYDWDLNE